MLIRFLLLVAALSLVTGCGERDISEKSGDQDSVISDGDTAGLSDGDSENRDDQSAASDEDSSLLDTEVADEDEYVSPLPLLESEDISTYNALIVTTEALASSFIRLAGLHTMLGIHTKVVTVEDICSDGCNDTDSKNDTQKKIKDYLILTPGLRFVILGGDIDDVPSRKVTDKYSNILAGSYDSVFYTDYYYSDFSEWDTNGDGVYAEDGVDAPDFKPEIGVSRIPVSTVAEADVYIKKVEEYIGSYDQNAMTRLAFTANIATEYNGIVINAGYYFESPGRSVSLVPPHFSIEKQYAATIPKAAMDATDLTVDSQIELFTKGTNLIVHNGHGSPSLLTCEQVGNDYNFTGDMAYNLKNTTYPIFLSCACQAGEFEAPFTYHYTTSDGVEKERVYTEDSPGERLLTAPAGGAIAYLGNTTTGLGLAGGSQLIDEMLRYIFNVSNPILGDALIAGHQFLKENDTFQPPVLPLAVPVVDPDSYRWTQKSVVLLGDLLIPVYTTPIPQQMEPIGIDVEKGNGELYITLPQTACDISLFDTQSYYIVKGCAENSCSYRIITDSKTVYGVRKCVGYQPKPFDITVD